MIFPGYWSTRNIHTQRALNNTGLAQRTVDAGAKVAWRSTMASDQIQPICLKRSILSLIGSAFSAGLDWAWVRQRWCDERSELNENAQ